MKNLLNIVNQKQTPIDEEKLILLCLHCYIWGHFGITQEESCSIPDQKQLQMLRKFYFDLERPYLKVHCLHRHRLTRALATL